jgi:hypothetical protein
VEALFFVEHKTKFSYRTPLALFSPLGDQKLSGETNQTREPKTIFLDIHSHAREDNCWFDFCSNIARTINLLNKAMPNLALQNIHSFNQSINQFIRTPSKQESINCVY